MSCLLLFAIAGSAIAGCGGGGGESGVPFQPGPYDGTTVFRTEDEENIGNCRDYVNAAIGSYYQLYITEQYFTDGSSQINIEHELNEGILASVPPGSDYAEFSESIAGSGFYGSEKVTCDGTRENSIKSESDFVISIDATLDLTCRVLEDSGNVFRCLVGQEGEIQVR